MDPLPVTIIVKAPNQQFEDQTIKCEPTWSIRKLKGYLTEVYPCNPTLEEQKLIYSGQLLNDAHILKDVLRRFEGQETHTVHLVYTPKNRQPQQSYATKPSQSAHKDTNQQSRSQTSQSTQQSPATTATSDGLRHRNVGSESSTMSNGPQQPMPGYMINPQQFMPGAWMPPNTTISNPAEQSIQQYMLAQQMAMRNMMNQMYMQYMNQHHANTFQNTNSPGSTPMPQYPPMNQFNQPNFGNVWNPNVLQNPNSTVDSQIQQQQQQNGRAPAVPAPPRLPANNNNDEEENRDWLEILYTLSRLLVLSSLVYFYSSPARCSIVIIVALLYYLYQRNVRERQQQEQGQVDRDADADVIETPVNNNNEQQPQQQGENNAHTDNNNEPNGEPTNPSSAPNEMSQGTSSGGEQDENNRLPTVALLRTFILSFFASLIPETPAV